MSEKIKPEPLLETKRAEILSAIRHMQNRERADGTAQAIGEGEGINDDSINTWLQINSFLRVANSVIHTNISEAELHSLNKHCQVLVEDLNKSRQAIINSSQPDPVNGNVIALLANKISPIYSTLGGWADGNFTTEESIKYLREDLPAALEELNPKK